MKLSHRELLPVLLALLLLPAGCASSPPPTRGNRAASYRLPTSRGGEPDAEGHPRGPNERGYVTGSNIPETSAERRNDPNAGATRVYDQDDLLRRGGGLSPDDSLSRLDPDFAIHRR